MKKIKLILFLIIVTIVFFMPKTLNKFVSWYTDAGAKIGQATGKKMADKFDFNFYSSKESLGSEIQNVEKAAFENNVDVYVKTLNSKDFVQYTKEKPYSITDKNNINYIDKNSHFKSSLKKNSDGKVIGIQLEQQSK